MDEECAECHPIPKIDNNCVLVEEVSAGTTHCDRHLDGESLACQISSKHENVIRYVKLDSGFGGPKFVPCGFDQICVCDYPARF